MIKKIREYFELRKLYNESKKILVINAASAITDIKTITEMWKNSIEQQNETIGSLSKDDLDVMTKFMSEMVNNKSIQETTIKEIVKGIKDNK